MEIPCRHIFRFLLEKKLESFRPDLCAQRWTKEYYYRSHPAIAGPVVSHLRPMHIAKVRTLDEKNKFKKAAAVTRDINNLVSNMSNSQFDFYIQQMGDFRSKLMVEFGQNHSVTESSSRELVDDTEGIGYSHKEQFKCMLPYWRNIHRSRTSKSIRQTSSTISERYGKSATA